MTAYSAINPDYLDSPEHLAWEAAYEGAYLDASKTLEALRDLMRKAKPHMAAAAALGIAPEGYDPDPDLVAAWADMDVDAAADEYARRVAGEL